MLHHMDQNSHVTFCSGVKTLSQCFYWMWRPRGPD